MGIDNIQGYENRLVYLTTHFHTWIKERSPDFNILMIGRLAKVIKVFDWNSKEGKSLLNERLKNKKWNEQDAKDFKYLLEIYYPDLSKDGKKGVIAPECIPLTGKDKKPLFDLIPNGILKQILSTAKFTISLSEKA
jgi:hypothetical protein